MLITQIKFIVKYLSWIKKKWNQALIHPPLLPKAVKYDKNVNSATILSIWLHPLTWTWAQNSNLKPGRGLVSPRLIESTLKRHTNIVKSIRYFAQIMIRDLNSSKYVQSNKSTYVDDLGTTMSVKRSYWTSQSPACYLNKRL